MARTCSKEEFAVSAPFSRQSHSPAVCSCRGLWWVQLALTHASPAWCALEHPAPPAAPWKTCQGEGQGLLLWAGLSAAPGFCLLLPAFLGGSSLGAVPRPLSSVSAGCVALPADRTELWDVAVLVRLAKTHRET